MSPVALALLAVLAAPGGGKERLAVLDFVTSGVDAELGVTLTQVFASELGKSGEYEIVGRDAIQALLGVEIQKQALGCGDRGCLAELGGMLDARYVVAGTLGKVGTLFVLSVQMIDSSHARVLNRASRRASRPEELAEQAPGLARELLAEAAVLHLYNQVPGVSVFVDDRFVGTMPLEPLPLRLAGAHRLRAEGADHLPFEAEIALEPGRTTRVRLGLESYDEVATKSETRDWLAAGSAVLGAGLGTAAVLSYRAGADAKRRYDAIDPTETTQGRLDALAGDVRRRYGLAYAAGGGALLLFGTAAWLFFANPYGEQLESVGGTALSPVLSPDAVGLSARFDL